MDDRLNNKIRNPDKMIPVHRTKGFTLVEIALVVVIASILLIAGMRLMIARAESAQIEVTRKNEDAIKTALISYLGQNNRLPCPDVNFDGQEDRGAPTNPPPCNAYVGTVPYVTLGLDKTAVLDGWDNYIAYVVSPNPSLPGPPASTLWTTSWLYTYVQTPTDLTRQTNTVVNGVATLAFWPTVSTGAITVNDVNGNTISNPNANPPTGAVVVLISYGRDGYGATNIAGNQNSAVGAGQDELLNITPVAAGPTILVVNRDITDQNIAGHGPFDDIVLPLRQNDLVAPLVASGTFPTSATQTLNQANDYVAALIVGTPPGRQVCSAACNSCVGFYYNLPAGGPVTPGATPITYAPQEACISSNAPAVLPAYTLQSLDGNVKTVTNGEAIGILGRIGGFN